MILKFQKLVAFDKIRYLGRCPKCKKSVLMDEDVFSLDTRFVECYSCKITYLVINIFRKSGFALEVIPAEEKGKK